MKIVKYKKIKNKYRVFFSDDSYIDLYEDIILKYNLLLKKEINHNELNNIKNDNTREEIYDKSLKYISIKMRTENEIRKYLERFKYDSDEIDIVISRLNKNNLLNEEEYVKAYIYDKLNLSNDGPNKIRMNLIKEKIDSNLVEKYIEEIDKEILNNKLNKLIDKKISTIKNCSGNVLKYKIVNYFVNLGYDKEIIENIISTKNINNTEGSIKEYTKLYNKYSKKYDGYKLESILREKMYLKGFDLDEIKRNID